MKSKEKRKRNEFMNEVCFALAAQWACVVGVASRGALTHGLLHKEMNDSFL